MKKILICLLAVLALGLCMLTLTPNAQAEETSDPILYHCKCGHKHSSALTDGEITWKEGTTECYAGCDGEILEWTAWSATSLSSSGNYYYTGNHTTLRNFTSSAIAGMTFNIDMNGYNIQVTDNRAININQASVSYCNTKTTGGSIIGYGTAKDAAAIYQFGSSSLTLYDVNVSCYNGGNSIKNGGAVYVSGTASFTTCGGSITGCSVSNGTSPGNGGTLFVKSTANVSLNGTTISGGSVVGNGGNIYVEDGRTGSFTMKNCVVYGGTATQYTLADGKKKDGGFGGNIWLGTVAADGPLAIMADCTIYGGTAVTGGSVMTKCRLAMQGGSIGVGPNNAEMGGVASYRGGNVFINNAELVMNLSATVAYGHCTNSTHGGNIYITGANGQLTMNHDSVVKHGNTEGSGGNVYVNSGAVSMGGNSSISNGKAKLLGGNVAMAGGTFTMKGESFIAGGGFTGTYGTSTAKAICGNGGNVYIGSAATFTMEGSGNVRNGMVTGENEQSGNFYVGGILNIGGTSQVYGGLSGANKRNIHLVSSAQLSVYGDAKVDGGITAAYGTVKISDNAVIDTYKDGRNDRVIYLAAAVTMDLTELDGGYVKLYDSATATGGRKLATVTADQTEIKDSVSILGTKLAGWVITREKDADGNVALWLREEASVAASAETAEGYYDYLSFADALAATDSTVKLLNDVDGATISKSILLDLAGHNMTNVTVPAEVTVSGMDSTTDDYDCTDGYGTLSGTVEGTIAHDIKTTAPVKRYLTINEDGAYSFHRIYLGITHMSLKPGVTGVGYKAVFYGDSKVTEQISGYGYNLWLDGSDKVVNASKDGAAFVSGQAVTLRLQNFDVAAYGETGVNANVFVTLKDGKTITSSGYCYTLKGLLEQVNGVLEQLTASQIAALQTMCQNNSEAMEGWSISNILNWTAE